MGYKLFTFLCKYVIAKRQYEGIKKVELILVKTRVFSIITSTSGETYSNDDVIKVDYEGRGRGVQNGQKRFDVIRERSLIYFDSLITLKCFSKVN